MKQPPLYLVAGIFLLGAVLFVSWLYLESRKSNDATSESAPSTTSPVNEKNSADANEVYASLDEENFGEARRLIAEIKSPMLRESLKTEMNQLIEAKLHAGAEDQTLLDLFLTEQCPYEDFWLEVAMRVRLSADVEHAVQWFEAHKGVMKPPLRERAALALCRHYGNLLEWQKAREMHTYIEDEKLAKVVDGEIGGAMERRLRRDVLANPQVTMASLLQKDSPYEVFWLEVAMNELLLKRPLEAGEWYQSAKATLLPEQHERIALACLRMQLGQNQIKEARQWRPLIVSSELAEVVDRELGVEVEE